MSDPTDLATTATQVVTGVGGATGVGLFMKWLQGREAAKLETQLALLMQKVDSIAENQKKHDSFGERLALVEQKLTAAWERLDGRRGARK